MRLRSRVERRIVSNFTTPSIKAKRVSSDPWPTFKPGNTEVPRWRIKIEPAVTFSPPYRLTPSLFELESRPLRVEPVPFLWAMGSCWLGGAESI